MGDSWEARLLLVILAGTMIMGAFVPCAQAYYIYFENRTSLEEFKVTNDMYVGSGLSLSDMNRSLVKPVYYFGEDNLHELEVKGNDTISERDMYQYVLGAFDFYVNSQLLRVIKPVFHDQSAPEYLSGQGSAGANPVWWGNGSQMNGPNTPLAPNAIPGYILNESGVYSYGSDTLRVVRMDLFDQRTYAESPEWYYYLILENVGNDSVYVNVGGLRSGNFSHSPLHYTHLGSGERIQVYLGGGSLNQMQYPEIDYWRVKKPEISPEFVNLKDFSLVRKSRIKYISPLVQLNKVSLVIDNAERNWTTLHIECQPTGSSKEWDMVNDTTLYIYDDGFVDSEVTLKKDGNITVLDIPLQGWDPARITRLDMSVAEDY